MNIKNFETNVKALVFTENGISLECYKERLRRRFSFVSCRRRNYLDNEFITFQKRQNLSIKHQS